MAVCCAGWECHDALRGGIPWLAGQPQGSSRLVASTLTRGIRRCLPQPITTQGPSEATAPALDWHTAAGSLELQPELAQEIKATIPALDCNPAAGSLELHPEPAQENEAAAVGPPAAAACFLGRRTPHQQVPRSLESKQVEADEMPINPAPRSLRASWAITERSPRAEPWVAYRRSRSQEPSRAGMEALQPCRLTYSSRSIRRCGASPSAHTDLDGPLQNLNALSPASLASLAVASFPAARRGPRPCPTPPSPADAVEADSGRGRGLGPRSRTEPPTPTCSDETSESANDDSSSVESIVRTPPCAFALRCLPSPCRPAASGGQEETAPEPPHFAEVFGSPFSTEASTCSGTSIGSFPDMPSSTSSWRSLPTQDSPQCFSNDVGDGSALQCSDVECVAGREGGGACDLLEFGSL